MGKSLEMFVFNQFDEKSRYGNSVVMVFSSDTPTIYSVIEMRTLFNFVPWKVGGCTDYKIVTTGVINNYYLGRN